MTEIGERVKMIREDQFLSVLELARLAGITRSAIYGVESGAHAPNAKTIRRLAAALGVAPQDLVKGT